MAVLLAGVEMGGAIKQLVVEQSSVSAEVADGRAPSSIRDCQMNGAWGRGGVHWLVFPNRP